MIKDSFSVSVNPTTETITIQFNKTLILTKYFNKFVDILKSKSITVNNVNTAGSKIVLTCPLGSGKRILDLFKEFKKKALNKELSAHNFIPINGGDLNEIKEDSIAALNEKCNLVLIKDIKEYEDANKTKDFRFNQYVIPFDKKDEYTDAIILIQSGKLDKIKEKYEPLLQEVEWN